MKKWQTGDTIFVAWRTEVAECTVKDSDWETLAILVHSKKYGSAWVTVRDCFADKELAKARLIEKIKYEIGRWQLLLERAEGE